ncbi:MAG: glycosyltransferase [Candidatus Methanoperedens sp.]|nr:glycosyltransferase [Candidatus Methanoperedens sp.]MCZ7360900.1 glycosyltransferase [Candidatus Methanoperedens sp.]HLB69694.1 glycosyltransferase [Candidatus Methanoperedens sp.]
MISVIIPAYNEEASITACLQSLCNQTLPRDEYEIIVVDGNSKDSTRELAGEYADEVFIQASKKVGGARNDGILRARGEIVATTDADCIIPPEWLEVIKNDFATYDIAQLYGIVYPIEKGIKNWLSLAGANNFSRLGYYTHTLYYTLGCNTAFDRETFIRVGMYRCIDAGDDLEIARRIRKVGRVKFDSRMRVGFSMRRYRQFGTMKSLYEWFYIISRGGESSRYTYSKRNYK